MRKLKPYHLAWLEDHPWRSKEWLLERLADGFDIHHLDGNHDNDAPSNLVLIDHADHLMLHADGKSRTIGRLARQKPKRMTVLQMYTKARALADENGTNALDEYRTLQAS